MSGRGSLLDFLKNEASISSGEQADDSGRSTGGDNFRTGRNQMIEDISSTLSKIDISVGRGRAQLLASLQSTSSGQDATNMRSLESSRKDSSKLEASSATEDANIESTVDYFNSKEKYGTKGNPVQLVTNYIKLTSDPNKGIYIYEVRFVPNVDSIQLRSKYLNEHKEILGGTKTFDGVLLYLPNLLDKKSFTLTSKRDPDEKDIEIRVQFKKKESFKNCIQFYNILFDRVMKALNYVRFDRKQFDPTNPKVIPMAKLEVWPGYVTAVDEYDGGLMLCCDVSHRILCQKTVLDLFLEIHQRNSSKFQEDAKKAVIGSVVITRYNNKTYRIDDVCFDKNPTSTFETRGGQTSYMDYYRMHHKIQIRDTKQPLLLSIKKVRGTDATNSHELMFCLVPEICHLTGLRDEMRSDYRLMREIAMHTRVSPNQRALALEKFYTNVNKSPRAKEILQNWGLTLVESREILTGRKFDEEQIFFAKNSYSAGQKAEFSKYVVSNELIDVVSLYSWILIHTRSDTKVAHSFIENMERNSKAFGMGVCKPKIVLLEGDRVESYVQALRTHINKQHQIVVCICPTNRDDRYAAIKKVCCAELPIPSQVINARTLSNESKNRSIVQKIALQMNCKMGGSLWAVRIPFKNVMICGIDSYHSAGQRGNSVAAFVASLNPGYTKWFSKAVIQTTKEEILNGLCSSFVAALAEYEKFNKGYPESVIIFRDGVGDGQLNVCSNYEIPQFEAACSNRVKITFIVVQKRINTRYFGMCGSESSNPLPGTVVDRHITRNRMYDFFLVSQSVREGTVSPSHYIVLRDDSNYGPNIIQRLSYKLCFLYYNWAGTIRVPACCQYAHKLAYLVGQSVQRHTADELATKLFYL